MTQKFIQIMKNCLIKTKVPIFSSLPERDVKYVGKRRRTNREFKFIVEVRNYGMEDVMLDLGFDVNILPKRLWDLMGRPKLVLSPYNLANP